MQFALDLKPALSCINFYFNIPCDDKKKCTKMDNYIDINSDHLNVYDVSTKFHNIRILPETCMKSFSSCNKWLILRLNIINISNISFNNMVENKKVEINFDYSEFMCCFCNNILISRSELANDSYITNNTQYCIKELMYCHEPLALSKCSFKQLPFTYKFSSIYDYPNIKIQFDELQCSFCYNKIGFYEPSNKVYNINSLVSQFQVINDDTKIVLTEFLLLRFCNELLHCNSAIYGQKGILFFCDITKEIYSLHILLPIQNILMQFYEHIEISENISVSPHLIIPFLLKKSLNQLPREYDNSYKIKISDILFNAIHTLLIKNIKPIPLANNIYNGYCIALLPVNNKIKYDL